LASIDNLTSNNLETEDIQMQANVNTKSGPNKQQNTRSNNLF